jgi:hypothetical protein
MLLGLDDNPFLGTIAQAQINFIPITDPRQQLTACSASRGSDRSEKSMIFQ